MIGKITKIDTLKSSRNKGEAFKRVYFKLKIREGEFVWAKTDIVMSFRNYKNWKGLLLEGNILDGLKLKVPGTVDADSKPILLRKAEESTPFSQEDIEKAEKIAVQNKLF